MAIRLSRKGKKVLFAVTVLTCSCMLILQHEIYRRSTTKTLQLSQGFSWDFVDHNVSRKNHTTQSTPMLQMLPCLEKPSTLKGNLKFEIPKLPSSLTHSEQHGGQVKFGGSWFPKDCKPIMKVAILIPYRKRPKQLEVFLSHMHGVFQRQKLNYRVFVIEQAGKTRFNKGAIYNIGFNATLSYDDYECFIFHDIDLLCENDHNFYGCPASPMHMSVAIDKFNYRLPYYTLFGGIQAIKRDHYIKINGYTNSFWGWGAEDDNLYTRIVAKGLKLIRPSIDVARYKMNKLHHFRSDLFNPGNSRIFDKVKKMQDIDGLNSLHKLNYTMIERLEPLYTLISINLSE